MLTVVTQGKISKVNLESATQAVATKLLIKEWSSIVILEEINTPNVKANHEEKIYLLQFGIFADFRLPLILGLQ